MLLASLVFLSKISFSQKTDSLPCPKLVLEGPRLSEVYEGQEALIKLKSFKKNTVADSSLTFNWLVDRGTIVKGQNSKEVRINTKGLQDEEIKAALIITGLAANCPNTANIVITVKKDRPVRTETTISTNQNGRGF